MDTKTMMKHSKTAAELAEILGISHDGALKLAKRIGIGRKVMGMWWFDYAEVSAAKMCSKKYLLNTRKK